MPGKNIAVPDEIYERVQKIATAEGTTVEELATKALERDLARHWLGRVGTRGSSGAGNSSWPAAIGSHVSVPARRALATTVSPSGAMKSRREFSRHSKRSSYARICLMSSAKSS